MNISNVSLVLEGSNLNIQGQFKVVSMNMTVTSGTSVIVDKGFVVDSSNLILTQSTITINGNFTILSSSVIELDASTAINVIGCASIEGQLKVSISKKDFGNSNTKQLLVMKYNCRNLKAFQDVSLKLNGFAACEVIDHKEDYFADSLITTFSLNTDKCNPQSSSGARTSTGSGNNQTKGPDASSGKKSHQLFNFIYMVLIFIVFNLI